MCTLALPSIISLSLLAILVSLLLLPPELICMLYHWKTSTHLTVEMNFSITEYTIKSEFYSGLLRKDLALESIYP